ncbi:trehalose-6-phosphate synthase [Chloroflexota bacterium]
MYPLSKQSNKSKIDKLVIASNRLPVSLTKEDNGNWQLKPSSGGLVTALAPVLRDMGGLWIGWPGTMEDANLEDLLKLGSQNLGYTLKPITLTAEELSKYYYGFSNEILWPLFHDLQTHCNFDPSYWNMYKAVNQKFAQVIAEYSTKNNYIWVNDYHLMLVAEKLRSAGVNRNLGFFLHIPFPPLDIFMKLPWREQVLQALLEYDLIGFQTPRDRNNFVYCVESMFRELRFDARRQVSTIMVGKREVRVGTFPVGIDFEDFAQRSASTDVAKMSQTLRDAAPCCQIMLGMDRLDYSKGIPERLRAFGNALERFSDLRGKIAMFQIVVPSRIDISEYQQLKAEIEGLVSEINGRFTRLGWIPIHYMYRHLDRMELLAYYRAADVALITPLKDGMNLIAKEYCAANIDESGVLVLSEFAGSARQLRRNSLLVNPYDIEGVADTIYRAHNMSLDERQLRMHRLRNQIAKRDVFWWVNLLLETATSK